MSRRFKAIVDESEEADGNGDDDDDDGVNETREKGDERKRKTRTRRRRMLLQLGGCNDKNTLRRAKKAVFSPFNNFQKVLKRYTSTRSSSSSSSSSSQHRTTTAASNLSRNSSSRLGNFSSCLCSSKPQSLDENEIDTIEDVKSLIERNEFFAKECNTHLDN